MSRAEYARLYYARTRERRLKLVSHRNQSQVWCRWLLANLKWPTEPEYVVAPIKVTTRPILRLPHRMADGMRGLVANC